MKEGRGGDVTGTLEVSIRVQRLCFIARFEFGAAKHAQPCLVCVWGNLHFQDDRTAGLCSRGSFAVGPLFLGFFSWFPSVCRRHVGGLEEDRFASCEVSVGFVNLAAG